MSHIDIHVDICALKLYISQHSNHNVIPTGSYLLLSFVGVGLFTEIRSEASLLLSR